MSNTSGFPLILGILETSFPFVVVLLLAGLVSAILLGLGLVAFTRRRSRPYLLLVLALGALVARSAVAGLTMFSLLPPTYHHLFEHLLDVVMASLVIGAVYHARTVSKTYEEVNDS